MACQPRAKVAQLPPVRSEIDVSLQKSRRQRTIEEVTAIYGSDVARRQRRTTERRITERRILRAAEANANSLPTEALSRYANLTSRDLVAPESLWEALRAGEDEGMPALRLVRLSYLRSRQRWRRRQEIEAEVPDAFIGVSDAQQLPRLPNGALPVLVVSHVWQDMHDPDPDGQQAIELLSLLERNLSGVAEAAIFVDQMSLYQHDRIRDRERTAEQQAAFISGLDLMNILFVHALCPVVVLNLANPDAKSDARSVYFGRGWPWAEFRLATLLKSASSWLVLYSSSRELRPYVQPVDAAEALCELSSRSFTNLLDIADAEHRAARMEGNIERALKVYDNFHKLAVQVVRNLRLGRGLHAWHAQWHEEQRLLPALPSRLMQSGRTRNG